VASGTRAATVSCGDYGPHTCTLSCSYTKIVD